MGKSIIIGLLQNTAILLAFSMLYDYFWSRNEKRRDLVFDFGSGIILGGIGIVLILTPWHFVPGIFFDTRSVFLSVSGLFFGPIPTITAMLIAGLYRLFMGGAGASMGIAVILTSGAIGLLWRQLRPDWQRSNPLVELAAMGILVHGVMLFCIVFLPAEIKWTTLRNMALPIILIYPVATVLLGALMLNHVKNRENRKALKTSEKRFRSIIEQATNAMYLSDLNGNILDCNHQACLSLGYSKEELLKCNITDLDPNYSNGNELQNSFHEIVPSQKLTFESVHRKKNGVTFPVEINTTIIELDGEQRIIGFASDITERKQAEQKIIRMAQHNHALIEKATDGIMLIKSEGTFTFTSPSARKIFGVSCNEEIIGNFSQFIHPDDLPSVLGVLQKLQKEPTLVPTIEYRVIDNNGQSKWVECTFSNLLSDPSVEAIVINFREITDRKEGEEKLISERKLLRTLIDNLPVAVYVKDHECRKIVANTFDLENIGIQDETMIFGKTDLELFDKEIGRRGYEDDLKVVQTGQPVLNRVEDFYDINGIQRWLLTSKIPLTDKNGKNIGLVGIGFDITEQRQTHEKILKLSQAIEQSPVSVIITDLKGNIEYINPRFSDITGYTAEEAIGQNPRILKSELTPTKTYRELWKTISEGNIWRGEMKNKKKDGSFFWEWATIAAIKNEKGVITNYIAIKEDISSRKKMEAELIMALKKAEESDELKSAFLANMSHEIRTPLNSIIGFSELLDDPDFDPEQKTEFIQYIVDNGNSLLMIISDIMDFSMLEAGQLKLREETISAKTILNELLSEFSSKAEKKGIQLRFDESVHDPDILTISDAYRIKQIFNNLIGNAIKFTVEGYVEIGYEIEDKKIQFHVKDTGIGIAPENHEAIFQRFRQVDLAKSRKFGGNGLGLAISKNLANLLGGDIWVESEPGKYSDFFFTIPICSSH